MIFAPNFEKCDMFGKCSRNEIKLEDLTATVASLDDDVRKLMVEHNVALQSQLAMKEDITKMSQSLGKHMDDEEEHHKNTTQALEKLVGVVDTLVDDQKEHRKEREKLEKDSEKKQARKDKVITAVLSAVSIAFTFWLFEVITNLDKVNKAIGVE